MGFKPSITVHIQITPFESKSVRLPLEKHIVYETWGRIDHPSIPRDHLDVLTNTLFCTGEYERQRVMRKREDVAEMLEGLIKAALLDSMYGKDTEMGYDRCMGGPSKRGYPDGHT